MQQHGTQQVLIAFDNDAAGNEAAVKLAARLAKLGVETFRDVTEPRPGTFRVANTGDLDVSNRVVSSGSSC
ncbi:toprim domain-containing protein [Serratia fonticola]|nr:toprim domain-containing protein [Serratia fonticola]MBL5827504.1 toprim domain-containing protein [Serratia fonticola]